MDTETIQTIHTLADTCIRLGEAQRPELIWLKDKHSRIQEKYHLKTKSNTDLLLYEKMYGHAPEKQSALLKLRYWRTGTSTPGNREQCLRYGIALELTEEELQYLIQNYHDRCLTVYPSKPERADTVYQQKCDFLKKLAVSYLNKIPQSHFTNLNISQDKAEYYLRHLYFTDALNYIDNPNTSRALLAKHIISSGYDSEFSRQLHLIGEISRKAMLRHLLTMRLPAYTLTQLNKDLSFLGYLPLDEEHTLIHGERMDWLIIHFLELYKKTCAHKTHEKQMKWFQEASRILDAYLKDTGHHRLRFMHFKALDW